MFFARHSLLATLAAAAVGRFVYWEAARRAAAHPRLLGRSVLAVGDLGLPLMLGLGSGDRGYPDRNFRPSPSPLPPLERGEVGPSLGLPLVLL